MSGRGWRGPTALVVTIGVSWVACAVLAGALGVATVDVVMAVVLLLGMPGLAMLQLPGLEDVEIERIPAYVGSILTLFVLGAATYWAGARSGGPVAVGLVGLAPLPMAAWTVGLTVAGLLVIVAFRSIAIALKRPDSPFLRGLLPRTPRERAVFGLLSLAAGTGEEIAYRGYLIPLLAAGFGMGVPLAVACSSGAFGLAHAYQGALGVVRTAVTGALLAGGFLLAGSLWPVMCAHVSIDVLAGIVWGERLLSPEAVGGVETPPLQP